MSAKAKLDNLMVYGAVGGVLLAVVYIASRGVAGATKDIVSGVVGGAFAAVGGALEGAYTAVPDVVKPSSADNIVYGAANQTIRVLPGSSRDETLGTWIYGVFHPNERF